MCDNTGEDCLDVGDDDVVWRFIHRSHTAPTTDSFRVGTGAFRNKKPSLFLPSLGASRDRIFAVFGEDDFGLGEILAREVRALGYRIVCCPADEPLENEPHAEIVPAPGRSNAERLAAKCCLVFVPRSLRKV